MSSRPPEPTFQRDLYRGTAADYDRYRLPYPDTLVAHIRDDLGRDGTGRLLDLGAGPGFVARALRPFFAHVVATDSESDMVTYGRARSEAERDGIEWRMSRAEDLTFPDASFEVIAAGNAFHRFERPVVAANAIRWLTRNGAMAALWSESALAGDEAWHHALRRRIDEWLERSGAAARIPPDWQRKDYPDEAVFRDAGFTDIREYEVSAPHDWTVDAIIGFLRATSFGSAAAMGEHSGAFEDAVRRTLLNADPIGVYRQDVRYGVRIASR
jgi:SAM-dependent methyltransferase